MLCCNSFQLFYGVSGPSQLSENGWKTNRYETVLMGKICKLVKKPIGTVMDKVQKILKIIEYEEPRARAAHRTVLRVRP